MSQESPIVARNGMPRSALAPPECSAIAMPRPVLYSSHTTCIGPIHPHSGIANTPQCQFPTTLLLLTSVKSTNR